MKRNLWTAGLTAALSAGILFMQPVIAEAGILPEGFSVAGAGDEALDFSGQTAEEASGKLEEYVGSMAEEPAFPPQPEIWGSTGKTKRS